MKIHHKSKHGKSLVIEQSFCELCDSKFEYYPSSKEGKICPKCIQKGNGLPKDKQKKRITVSCTRCNNKIEMRPCIYNIRNKNQHGIFCSDECYKKWRSDNWAGEQHPQYEGYSKYTGKWRKIRRKTLKRDSYSCRKCGISKEDIGHNPDVHHIVPVKKFDNEQNAHTLDNTISLCRKCHRNIEEDNMDLPSDFQ